LRPFISITQTRTQLSTVKVKVGSASEGVARLKGGATWKAGESNLKLAGRDKSQVIQST